MPKRFNIMKSERRFPNVRWVIAGALGISIRIGLIGALALALGFKPDAVAAESNRMVGIAYSTNKTPATWKSAWGTPLLGQYTAGDTAVIAKHAEWLADAGVDFIFVDWSNDLPYWPGCGCRRDMQNLEEGTYGVFDTYVNLPRHPKIAIMIGFPGDRSAVVDGSLQRKADQVFRDFLENKKRAQIYQTYEGKPLLIVYAGTPSPYQQGLPPWSDPRFTVRFMTGFLTNQPPLLGPDRVSKYGYWSWEDRGPQSYTVESGHPATMTVTASWRGNPSLLQNQLRMGGKTFIDEWARATEKGVSLVLVVSWNEWGKAEQISPQQSKDLEPSAEFGRFYLDLLKKEIAIYKKS